MDRNYLAGGIILLNGMLVSCTAKNQGGVTLSTMESSFVDTSEQARELLGIKVVLCEIWKSPMLPMTLNVGNQAVLKQLGGLKENSHSGELPVAQSSTLSTSLCHLLLTST